MRAGSQATEVSSDVMGGRARAGGYYGAYVTALLVAFAVLGIHGDRGAALVVTAAPFLLMALSVLGLRRC